MQTKLRKIVSIVVCMALLLTSLTISGATLTSAAAGTAEDPVLIKTVDDLKAAVKSTSKTYYKLANDIVINDITVKIENGVGVIYNAEGTVKLTEEELSKLTPWINEGYADTVSRFKGTLDGDGHVIRGLYLDAVAPYEKAGDDYRYARALISYAGDGTAIKNLGLEDAYVSYEYGTASGFIGNMQSSKVSAENCYVGKSAYFYGYNASAFFGSGNQGNKASYVKNGYCLATLKLQSGVSDTRFGAIYADVWNSKTTAENFYTTTKLAHAGVSRIENVYDYVQAKQGNIGTAFEGNTFFPGDVFCAVEGELPTLKYFKGVAENVWSGLGDSELAGAGTSADPYLITSGEELAYVVYKNGDIDANVTSKEYFALTNDIYLNDVSKVGWKENENNNIWNYAENRDEWSAMEFMGHLDGQGYAVCGIWIPEDADAYSAGLIVKPASITVQNLAIKEAQIAAGGYAGGIIGYWSGSKCTVSNCYIDSTVDLYQTDKEINGGAGGIVGYIIGGNNTNYFTIENCGSAANCFSVTGKIDRANSLIGTVWNAAFKVKNCYAVGNAPFYCDAANSRVSILAKSGGEFSMVGEVYQNVYGDVSKTVITGTDGAKAYTALSSEEMLGESALSNLSGFSSDVWYSVKDADTAPMLRVMGAAMGDVDEDGVGCAEGDIVALHKGLIGFAEAKNGNYNRDGSTNVLDLVGLVIDEANLSVENCTHVYKAKQTVESDFDTDGIITHTCRRCDYSYEENIGTSIKLLAIGSSHTMNSITYFGEVCEAAGIDNVYLGHMYKGGVTFQQQYEDATGIDTNGDGVTSHTFSYRTYDNSKWSSYVGNMHVADVIGTYDWDFVVINQGAIDAPLYGQELLNGDVKDSYETYFDWQVDYITELAPNATLCWNMTFACEEYETGDPRYNECDLKWQYKNWFGFDSHVMYNAIAAAAEKYVMPREEIEIFLPSATTVQNVRSSYRGQTLTNDLTHLDDDPENLHGRYAVGLTWFKAITGADLSEFDWVPEDNLIDDLPMIREAVNNAIANPLTETESSFKTAP